MTAAGFALIAGGLAILVCFHTVLFSAGGRRARRAARLAEGSPLVLTPAPPAAVPVDEIDTGEIDPARIDPARIDPARIDPARIDLGELDTGEIGTRGSSEPVDDGRRGGLASIGFADDEDEHGEPAEDIEPYRATAGEYWRPIPASAYEPALEPVEPEPLPTRRRRPISRQRPTNPAPTWADLDVNSHYFPPIDDPSSPPVPPRPAARRRPSPRPRPQAPDDRDDIYVSRHAADPPP
jgi:hypothetical protein